MSAIINKPVSLADEAGKIVAKKLGIDESYAPLFSITIGFIIFLILFLITFKLIISTENFGDLITPKGEIPYFREFQEMPLQTAVDVSLFKKGKCLCNSVGACDYCLDSSMEERTDHINHMMNRRPKALYSSVSQMRNNVLFDLDKNNLDYKNN